MQILKIVHFKKNIFLFLLVSCSSTEGNKESINVLSLFNLNGEVKRFSINTNNFIGGEIEYILQQNKKDTSSPESIQRIDASVQYVFDESGELIDLIPSSNSIYLSNSNKTIEVGKDSIYAYLTSKKHNYKLSIFKKDSVLYFTSFDEINVSYEKNLEIRNRDLFTENSLVPISLTNGTLSNFNFANYNIIKHKNKLGQDSLIEYSSELSGIHCKLHYLKYDSHGNWRKRVFENSCFGNSNLRIESRVIEYY